MFLGTAGIALAISLFLWLSLGWLSKREVTDNIIGIGKAIIILFKFPWQPPSHAAILILFALCHSSAVTRLVLFRLGLWDIIWDKKAPRPTGFSLSSTIGQRNRWSKIWYHKVAQVEDSVKTSEWQRKYLSQKKDGQVE